MESFAIDTTYSENVGARTLVPPQSRTKTKDDIHRLVSLFGGFCAMLATGSAYGWCVVAASLHQYGYTRDDELVIGTMATLSVYISFHTGWFFDRYGARASLLLGMILTSGGWLLTWWGTMQRQPAPLVGLYQALCSQGVQPITLAAMENVMNFDVKNRGISSAAVIVGFGMTSVAMAQLHQICFPNLAAFLKALSIGSALLIFFQLTVFVRPPAHPGAAASQVEPEETTCTYTKSFFTSPESYLFLFTMMCFGMSLQFWVVNVAELMGTDYTANGLVSTFGICNILARLITGRLSDIVPISRSQLLAIGCLFVSFTMVLMMVKFSFFCAVCMGISDGFMFAIWFPLTREVHGPKKYGITLAIHNLSLGCGDVVINFLVCRTVLKPTSTLGELFLVPLICSALMLVSAIASYLLHIVVARRALA